MPDKINFKTLSHMNYKELHIMTKDSFHQENSTVIILYT